MELAKLLAFITFVATTTAWKNTLAFEFTGPGCSGQLAHAWIVGNTTQSVYISTINDGIYRWYGFAGSTADGHACYGDLVGRMHSPCFDLTSYVAKGKPKVECIRYCSLWADEDDMHSCAAIGVTE
ncbi:hypothetical protein HD806DRAFT_530765 [Xylariaceae sp. AK1471]|nr:hypothetical protein HD806DRAFT_530765 [Xylariaceae sp. AK1471]